MRALKFITVTLAVFLVIIPVATIVGLLLGWISGVICSFFIGTPKPNWAQYFYGELLLFPITIFLALVRITLFTSFVWLPIWLSQSKHPIFSSLRITVPFAGSVAVLFWFLGRALSPKIFNTGLISEPYAIARFVEFVTGGITVFSASYLNRSAFPRPSIGPHHAEKSRTGQPATRPETNSDGGDKPQPEAEGRSR